MYTFFLLLARKLRSRQGRWPDRITRPIDSTTHPLAGITHHMAYRISDDCKGCGACAKKCPEHAIDGKIKAQFHIDPFLCVDCGTCFNTCPQGAIIDPKGNRSPRKGKKDKTNKARIEVAICAGCQNCFLNCPQGAIRVIKKNILTSYCHVDSLACLGCGTCTQFCITGAVGLNAQEDEENSPQDRPPAPKK